MNYRSSFVPPSYAEGGMITPPGPTSGQAGLTPPGGGAQGNATQQATQFAAQNPQQVQQLKAGITEMLQAGEMTMQDLNMVVQIATAASQNPQLYPQLRQFVIQKGIAEEGDISPEYDEGVITMLLIIGQAFQGEMGGAAQPQGQIPTMAGGGPVTDSNVSSTDKPDTMLAYVQPREFMMTTDAAEYFGTKYLDGLNAKAKEAKEGGGQPKPKEGATA
tara:strand:- start:18743 stop:19396 length:654 start_codon:yes stop_codon:yes gene_type:complete